MFGRLQTDLNYSLAQIRDMTLDDVERLYAHWRKHPTLRMMKEAELGLKPEEESPPQYLDAEGMKRLMALTGGRVSGVKPM